MAVLFCSWIKLKDRYDLRLGTLGPHIGSDRSAFRPYEPSRTQKVGLVYLRRDLRSL
jgi:hypothetical protein